MQHLSTEQQEIPQKGITRRDLIFGTIGAVVAVGAEKAARLFMEQRPSNNDRDRLRKEMRILMGVTPEEAILYFTNEMEALEKLLEHSIQRNDAMEIAELRLEAQTYYFAFADVVSFHQGGAYVGLFATDEIAMRSNVQKQLMARFLRDDQRFREPLRLDKIQTLRDQAYALWKKAELHEDVVPKEENKC